MVTAQVAEHVDEKLDERVADQPADLGVHRRDLIAQVIDIPLTEAFGIVQPVPAPRFSRTPGRIQSAPTAPGADSVDVLRTWGFDDADIERLIAQGVVCPPGAGQPTT